MRMPVAEELDRVCTRPERIVSRRHGAMPYFVRIAWIQLFLCTHTRWVYLHSSGASIPHLNLSSIHDDRHLAFSA